MLVFYDSETSTFCFSFKIPRHRKQGLGRFFQDHRRLRLGCEYIIGYHMTQVSSLEVSAEGEVLKIRLNTPPRFYIRDPNGNDKGMKASQDFTRGQKASHCLVYSLRSALGENLKQLKDWLHYMQVSANEKLASKQDPTEWNAALERLNTSNLETTKPNNTSQWILDVTPNSHLTGDIDQVVLPDDVDNMIGEMDSLLWRSESEYHAAEETAKAIRWQLQKVDGVETSALVKGTNIVSPNLSGYIARYRNAMTAAINSGDQSLVTRVALIDTRMKLFKYEASNSAGFMPWSDDLLMQIDAVKSFVSDEDLNRRWIYTSSLYTNQIAQLVCSIDPLCRLYIAQVAKAEILGVSTDAVAKAINWAVDCDVDVISLNFEMRMATENIKKAIQLTRDNDIVVLRSVAYDSSPEASLPRSPWADLPPLRRYPGLDYDSLIIAACDSWGKLLNVRSVGPFHFGFVSDGIHVGPLPWLASSALEGDSSVATAVAAGVVSLIVASFKLGKNNINPYDMWRRLIVQRKLDAMCDEEFVVLDNICGKEKREYQDFMEEIKSNFLDFYS
ncbi:hypothetical protein GGR51DRAFT_413196 [Nemania sp. FL0031]|nr:hypothetical protein GGR51DRAFT_413196 [Nemania sp. FL0031]